MHQAATPSNEESVATSAKIDIEQHKFVRKIVSLIFVVSAVVITLYVWGIIERHPRTDDATARANVVGIAPRVSGQIIKLNVQDNQAVRKATCFSKSIRRITDSSWKRPKLNWPLWINSSHKPMTPCTAWSHSCPMALPPPTPSTKPEPQ